MDNTRIELGNDYRKYFPVWGEKITIERKNKKYTGTVRSEYPGGFDKNLIRGEHYYGEVNYYLEILD